MTTIPPDYLTQCDDSEVQALAKRPTTWRCASCGRKLPTRGMVWQHRKSHHAEGQPSGYYCDPCADMRESGMDY